MEIRATLLAALVVLSLVAVGPIGAASTTSSTSAPLEGFEAVPQDNLGPTVDEWDVHSSDHADTTEVEIVDVDGAIALEASDNSSSEGRTIAVDRTALASTLGYEPTRVSGSNDAGDWTANIRYSGDYAMVDVPHFSTNVIEFNGSIEFSGDSATSSTGWDYQIDDLESVDNLAASIEGKRATESRSESITTDDGSLDLETRGSSAPENAEVTLEGISSDEAVSEDLGTVSDGSSNSIDVGGSVDATNEEVTITGREDSAQHSESGTVTGTESVPINVDGNLDPTDHTGNADPALSLDYLEQTDSFTSNDGSIELASDRHEVDTRDTITLDTNDYVQQIEHVFGVETDSSNDELGLEVYVAGGDVGDSVFNTAPIRDESRNLGTGSNVFEETYDINESYGTDQITVGLEATTDDLDVYYRNDDWVDGSITADSRSAIDFDAQSGTESVSFDSAGTKRIPLETGDDLAFSGSGGASWSLEWQNNWQTVDPSVGVTATGGTQTVSHSGTLAEGETVSESINLAPGSYSVDTSTGYQADVSMDWTERNRSVDPIVDVAGETVSHNGQLDGGETVTQSISLNRNTDYTADVWGDGPVSASINWTDVSESRDPTVEINGHSVGVDGVLAEGSTQNLSVDPAWIEEGTNEIDVSLADGNGGPTPQVGVSYAHDASTSASASVDSTTWVETSNASRTFASDQSDVSISVPFSNRVAEIQEDGLEIRVGGGSWHEPDQWSYDADTQQLTATVGDVGSGETVEMRATGTKFRALNGVVRVLEPTIEGNELDTEIELESVGEEFGIDVSNTLSSDRVHHFSETSWTGAEPYSEIDANQSQILRTPEASDGASANVTTTALEAVPSTGSADVTINDPDEPQFALDGVDETMLLTWHDTEPGAGYDLWSISDEANVDSSESDGSAVSLTANGNGQFRLDSSEGGGPGPVSGESSTNLVLVMVVSIAGMIAFAFVGRRWGGVRGIGDNSLLAIGGAIVGTIGLEAATSRSILAQLIYEIGRQTDGIGAVVIGSGVLLAGWLIYRSDRVPLPPWIGVIGAGGAIMWMIESIAPGSISGGLEDVSAAIWVIVIGGGLIIIWRIVQPRPIEINSGGDES